LFADYLETPTKSIKDRGKFCDHTLLDEFRKTVKMGGKTLGKYRLYKLLRGKWVPLHKEKLKGIKFIKSKKRGKKK